MWDLPLFAQFLFVLFPLVVVMIIVVKVIKIISNSFEGNIIQFISLLPYIFIVYYIWNWMLEYGDEEAMGYSNGTFQPINVVNQITVSASYLMEDALPTCMAMILIWGILSIVAHHVQSRGASQ